MNTIEPIDQLLSAIFNSTLIKISQMSTFMFKKSALVCALAIAAPFAALASDGTITFNGSVVATSCSVQATNGTSSVVGDQTVTLPPVNDTQLSTAGNTAGQTQFAITVSGTACQSVKTSAGNNATGFAVLFEPNGAANTAGRLTNSAAMPM